MSDLFNFVRKYNDVIMGSRDISRNRLQNFLRHMIDYYTCRVARLQDLQNRNYRGGLNQPLRLPRASNTLGLIGVRDPRRYKQNVGRAMCFSSPYFHKTTCEWNLLDKSVQDFFSFAVFESKLFRIIRPKKPCLQLL